MHHPHRDELINALTHGAGAVASLAGGASLITLAALSGDARQIVGASVFVASLVLLYTASTLYHAFRHETVKARLQVLDHCAIFVLIAGSYTPFTLVSLWRHQGVAMLCLVWGMAVAGVLFKLYSTGRFDRLSTVLYLAMGWMAVAMIGPLWTELSTWALSWLAVGGLLYTAGTVFFWWTSLRHHHAIWHLFVLGGSTSHFVAVAAVVLG